LAVIVKIFDFFFGNFRRFHGYIGPKFIWLIGAIVAGGLFESIGIGAFLPILKAGQPADDRITQAFRDVLAFLEIPPDLPNLLLMLVLIFLAKGVATLVQEFIILRVHTGLTYNLRMMLIKKFGAMQFSYYSDTTTGYLNNIVTVEIERMIAAVMRFVRMIVNGCYVMIYMMISATINMQMTLFMMGLGLVLLIVARPFVQLSQRYSLGISEANAALQHSVIEFIQNYVYIKATNTFSRFFRHLEEKVGILRQMNFRVRIVGAVMTASIEPIGVILVAGLLFYQIEMQGKAIAEFLVLAMFFYRTFGKLLDLQVLWQKFNENLGGLVTIEEAGKMLDANREVVGDIPVDSAKLDIELNGVSFAYKDHPVLYDLSLRIPTNKTIAIVGESGAGKTTVFGMLTGMLSPDDGRVSIGDTDYLDLDKLELRRHFGYVTQEPVIFLASIAENISMWASESGDEATMDRVKRAAEQAHCMEFIERMPDGFDTIVGERGIRLSGGQRQRIAIARELYKEPAIMIFDEATSSLDTDSERLIQASINEMKGEKTLIIIAHRLSTIRNADYIYVISKGRLVESGTFDELRSFDNGTFQRIYASQQL
jgi:ABC-type multidrug transport system fused ATPase/permease subunit